MAGHCVPGLVWYMMCQFSLEFPWPSFESLQVLESHAFLLFFFSRFQVDLANATGHYSCTGIEGWPGMYLLSPFYKPGRWAPLFCEDECYPDQALTVYWSGTRPKEGNVLPTASCSHAISNSLFSFISSWWPRGRYMWEHESDRQALTGIFCIFIFLTFVDACGEPFLSWDHCAQEVWAQALVFLSFQWAWAVSYLPVGLSFRETAVREGLTGD